MTSVFVAPLLRRSLAAVFRFYDAFYFPIDDRTPPIDAALEVAIPSLGWTALRNEADATYRFSALTLEQPVPSGPALAVQVVSARGDYVSFEPIVLTLPRAVSTPPRRSDYLIALPLWPTTAFRPPGFETAVYGRILSPTAQPVSDLRVRAWTGGAPLPPPGSPYTRSNAQGEFLFRFPLLKGAAGRTESISLQLADGAVAVAPTSVLITRGQTQIIELQRS